MNETRIQTTFNEFLDKVSLVPLKLSPNLNIDDQYTVTSK